MLNRVLSILSSPWLIHKDTAISYLPALVAFVRGQNAVMGGYQHPKPYARAAGGPGESINTAQYHWELTDPDLPENAVAVIGIDGPICSWNTMDILTRFKEVQCNDRINAVLLTVNSPGGMVLGLDLLTSTIKSLGKPTVAMTIGMTASAACWITSGATRRIATSKMDLFGSVGIMTTLTDFSKLFEKYGITVQDIYATKSTRKNEDFRKWKETGDVKPTQDFLDKINEFFLQAIMENLGIKEGSEVLTGATFYAEDAIAQGLIDEINTMDYCLELAYQLGLENKIKTQFQPFNH